MLLYPGGGALNPVKSERHCDDREVAEVNRAWWRYVAKLTLAGVCIAAAGHAQDEAETIVNSIGMKFRLIPAGRFLMGSNGGDADEQPIHAVRVSNSFYLGIYEVTQTQWRAVMGTSPSHFQGADRPVEQVSWNEAREFCRRLSEREGARYRLPTEAEWEYACRAGTATEWHWGDHWDDTLNWVGPPTAGETKPVGGKPPNPWGLYDIYGNVWEWCEDLYAPYADVEQTDPCAAVGRRRVCRGGGAYSIWRYARSAARGNGFADECDYHLGFRVVRAK